MPDITIGITHIDELPYFGYQIKLHGEVIGSRYGYKTVDEAKEESEKELARLTELLDIKVAEVEIH